MDRIMLNKFIFLLIILFSFTTIGTADVIALPEVCPANRAIYKSEDGSKTFETTDFAMLRRFSCENYGEKYSFRVPTVGYLQTPSPTTEEMGGFGIVCRAWDETFLKGIIDENIVYVYSFVEPALPCCGEISYTESEFKERFKRTPNSEGETFLSFPETFLWLEGELVPDARDQIDTLTNWEDYNIWATNGSQPLGEDFYHLSDCSKDSFWKDLLSKIWK